MAAKRCWDCGTTFYSDYGAIYCNVCHQARETRKHNERQAQRDRWENEQAQREAARIQAQHTQALINAENARIAAINHQTQVIAESAITSKYAYDRGYSYVDNEFGYSNPANLNIEVNEYGTLEWNWNYLYVTDRLNDEFQRGLGARLNQYASIYDTIKDSARTAGKGNADGSFPSTYFNLWTGLNIGGVDIKTKSFKSYFTSELDEDTGELKMNWKEPFTNPELNKAYQDGASDVYWAENTPEKKNFRLRVQVPEIKAERIIIKSTKRLNKFFRFLVYAIPILFFLLMWQITSGWVTVGMFFASFIMRNLLKIAHLRWANDNQYLRK